jgi:tetratricopeptide (TPR) repeat protein
MAIRIIVIHLVSLLFAGGIVWGQSGDRRLGDQEFKQLNYARAIVAYEKAPDKNLRAYRNLAECYLLAGKLENARYCLEKVCESSQRTASDLWDFAQIQMRLQEYEDARNTLQAFVNRAPRDSRAKAYKNAGDFPETLTESRGNYAIRYLPFNSHEQDFGAAMYQKQLVFTSTRRPFSPIVREWNGNQRDFLNIYIVNPYQGESQPKYFDKQFNGRFNEGPIAFSGDGKVCAITRTNYEKKDANGMRNLALYLTEHDGKKWRKPEPFPFNDSTWSVGHASLNEDGTVMYFVSDMPGGRGGTDIWTSQMIEGKWEKPTPVYSVNTEADEMFPCYLEEPGVLLFASDGHVGLGGLDIFAAKRRGEQYVKIRNMGAPINSSSDDFGLWMSGRMSSGFFTSTRPAPSAAIKKINPRDSLLFLADDDLYWMKCVVPFEFGKTIYGTVWEGVLPLEGVDLVLLDSNQQPVKTATTGENGAYEFPVRKAGRYSIKSTKELYFDTRESVTVLAADEDIELDLGMKRDPNISIRLVISNSEDAQPLPGVNLEIKNLLTGDTIQYLTPSNGEFFLRMPQKRLHDSLSMEFKVMKAEHLTKTVTYSTRLDDFGNYDIHKARVDNRFLDFSMKKKTIGDDLALQLGVFPYYYEIDSLSEVKTAIEPAITKELQPIVQAMLDNPGLKIEVINHTDCRGSTAENLKLSQKRAQSIATYIRDRISDGKNRVKSSGAGEAALKSGCSCDAPGGGNCNKTDYQIDRRTEFIITGI